MRRLLTNKRQTKLITFTDTVGVANEYKPQPAIYFIPEWYKEMEPSFPKEKKPSSLPSIKKCIPVLDAITAGYILVSPCDVYVTIENGEPVYNSAIPNFIHFHPRKQAYKHPKVNDYQFPKWKNPWAIKTPKGYSTLFVPPMHNPNERFVILEGLVDTDTYSAPVHFPFVLKTPTEEFLIPAGTPIAQAIPIKRDNWISEISENNEEPHKITTYLTSKFSNRYKHMFWQRKSYS